MIISAMQNWCTNKFAFSSTYLCSFQGIDQELKKACESLISFCVDIVATPIRDWTARVRVYSHSASSTKTGASDTRVPETKPLIGQEWASESSARTLETEFRSACERDLRGHAARVGLYLEDARTVGVLLGHVRERAMDEYVAFAEAAGGIHPDLKGSLMSEQEVGAFLRRVCAVDGNS
jgi:phage baseplate assembly protein W